jgi:hypothetical protein
MVKRLAVVVPVVLLVASFVISAPMSTAFAHSSAQAHVYTTAHTSAQHQIHSNQQQAKDAIPLTFCQGPYYFQLDLNPHGTWQRDCSGDYTVNLYVYAMSASRWSGYLMTSSGPGQQEYQNLFCNGNAWTFDVGSDYVDLVHLSSFKEPWC